MKTALGFLAVPPDGTVTFLMREGQVCRGGVRREGQVGAEHVGRLLPGLQCSGAAISLDLSLTAKMPVCSVSEVPSGSGKVALPFPRWL